MPRLLLATKNAHKTGEIRALLGPEWTVQDLNEFPEIAAPEETGLTFADNAKIKALAASGLLSGLVLADDSGLEVDALGGAPGVRSARYAGEKATDAENRRLLLRETAGRTPRSARFRCVLALAEGGEITGLFDGTVEGEILEQERGAGGFGYDSLFVPAGYTQTFAELPDTVKNRESHRARAMAAALEFLTPQG